MGDTVINAGGGVSNAKKTGNGGGTLDYGQVTIPERPSMKTTRSADFPRAVRFTPAPSSRMRLSPSPATGRNPAAAARSTAAET